jgi:pyruvate dehydrogenase E1 component alpha subunit
VELIELYRRMARARAFELLIADLWNEGRISGEMHLATGEEAVAAGVTACLVPGDAVALDHRTTAVMLLLGVDPVAMVRELLGREDGLCRGQGGHMHLFSRDHLAASSGIVGAAGPLGAGFALAAKRLRPGKVALSFFGEGAVNQGMLLESFNLAVAWQLPQVFVCKDNGWAITTRSDEMTGGDLESRARGFGLAWRKVDGLDARATHAAAAEVIERARTGGGPSFLCCRVSRLDGHFLGDQLVGAAQRPLTDGRETLLETTRAALSRGGGSVGERARSVGRMLGLMRAAREDSRDGDSDPLRRARQELAGQVGDADEAERAAAEEMAGILDQVDPEDDA